jgi:hypothetical protein
MCVACDRRRANHHQHPCFGLYPRPPLPLPHRFVHLHADHETQHECAHNQQGLLQRKWAQGNYQALCRPKQHPLCSHCAGRPLGPTGE